MPRSHTGRYLGAICVLLALSPLLLLVICMPLFWLLECAGNEGTGVRCALAPGLSDFASSVSGIGTWGVFFTLPVAVVLYVVGAIVRFFARR